MNKPDIIKSYESVTFVGCQGSGNIIFRPKAISATQWLEFWESLESDDPKKLRKELEEANEEIACLKAEISDLEQRVYELESEP